MVLSQGSTSVTPQGVPCAHEAALGQAVPGCWRAGGHPGHREGLGEPLPHRGQDPPHVLGTSDSLGQCGGGGSPGDLWRPRRRPETAAAETREMCSRRLFPLFSCDRENQPSAQRGLPFGAGPRIRQGRPQPVCRDTEACKPPTARCAEVDGQSPDGLTGRDIPQEPARTVPVC